MGAILAGPVVLAVITAAVRLYPLGTRVNVFLLPLLLLLVVMGAEHGGRLVHRHYGAYLPVLLLPFAVTTFLQRSPPIMPEHLRPVMQYVANNWNKDDAVWGYYGAGPAFQYYVRRIPLTGDIRVVAALMNE